MVRAPGQLGEERGRDDALAARHQHAADVLADLVDALVHEALHLDAAEVGDQRQVGRGVGHRRGRGEAVDDGREHGEGEAGLWGLRHGSGSGGRSGGAGGALRAGLDTGGFVDARRMPGKFPRGKDVLVLVPVLVPRRD